MSKTLYIVSTKCSKRCNTLKGGTGISEMGLSLMELSAMEHAMAYQHITTVDFTDEELTVVGRTECAFKKTRVNVSPALKRMASII